MSHARDELAPLVASVPDRSSRRFPHHCGDGRPLQISRDGPTVRAYCHRCQLSEGWRLEESFQDRLARLQAQGEGDRGIGQGLPHPPTYPLSEWPLEARTWLWKAGLTEREILTRRIYWHAPSDRVVIPYPEQGFWCARAYQKGRVPKYLSPTPKPRDLCVRFGAGDLVVLTEDILSAMKVSRVTEAWALLGTKLSQDHCARLIADGRPVVTWLDPDDPGQVGATKIRAQLRAFGVPVRNVVSLRDPKLHSAAEIKGYLYG
jgi:hypothetical protein